MADEMVDIVDQHNSVIDVSLKSKAHELGLLHRTVIAEVINAKGEWLLVKQSSTRQDAGQYVSPVGGHVQAGESEEDALKREAFEEIGIRVKEYNRIGQSIFNRKVLNRTENHMFIVYEIHMDADILLNSESESYRWFSKNELQKEFTSQPTLFGDAFHFVVKTFYPNLLI
jgi:8-oxo-dGTP pyrophosphatase MutT (NUDIX family)